MHVYFSIFFVDVQVFFKFLIVSLFPLQFKPVDLLFLYFSKKNHWAESIDKFSKAVLTLKCSDINIDRCSFDGYWERDKSKLLPIFTLSFISDF